MFILNGQPLPLDTPFTGPDGIRYPANWLRLSTQAEKEAIGISEAPEPAYYDQRFYWGYDSEGNLIPKDHQQLVTQWQDQTRTTAGTLLSPTDWMVIRELDNGTPMNSDIKTWREQIRLESAQKVEAIGITTTTDELATYVTSSDYASWSSLNPVGITTT